MTIACWCIFGALIGWIASIVMRRNSSMGAIANIAVGLAGAAIGGFLFNRQVQPELTLASGVTALAGALILLAIANLATRGSVR